MRSLSFVTVIILLLPPISINSQSKHGEKFNLDCSLCHDETGWEVNPEKVKFDHSETEFPLTGNHKFINCSSCHTSLIFSEVQSDCISCHKDIHAGTTGADCSVCHTPSTWIVQDINNIHMQSRFQLIGAHKTADCQQCHGGYAELNFEPLGINCIDCHSSDYFSTQNPNHLQAGFPTTCNDCHTTSAWIPAEFDHDLTGFPLTGSHITADCSACHESGFSGTPTDCSACHLEDFNSTINPNHTAAGFPVTCNDCHTTTDWVPAQFDHDGMYFPIYSGKHNNEWDTCADCHTVQNNFSIFSCIDCHEHNREDMDDEHGGVNGYIYESTACLNCHPDGSESGAFNHNNTGFILDGAHTFTECSQCHQSGYAGTSALCYDCHNSEFTSALNPDHNALSLPTDCSTCHSTAPGWSPASFPIHNEFFILTGRHLEIASDCSSCHNGNYVNTQNQCYDCHQTAYNSSQNPDHISIGISTECSDCHTSTAWIPSLFSHSATAFPLTGQHADLLCTSCHEGTTSGLSNECYSCHQDQYNSAPEHTTQSYPINCELCHNSTSWSQVSFDHQLTGFPLSGAHTSVDCSDCHESGYSGTSAECISCHQENYQQSTNPNHVSLSLPTDCESCHTTDPGWEPALFPDHNSYYLLTGAHSAIASNCSGCHNGNYNNTPSTCIGCHEDDYNSTNDPPHVQFSFSTDCLDCHSMNGWNNANFNHSFYPISSDHNNVDCGQCHSQANYQPDCLSCHLEDFLDKHNLGDPTNCWDCHNTFDWDDDAPLDPGRNRGVRML
jgi:hypothetical protein